MDGRIRENSHADIPACVYISLEKGDHHCSYSGGVSLSWLTGRISGSCVDLDVVLLYSTHTDSCAFSAFPLTFCSMPMIMVGAIYQTTHTVH